MDNIEHIWEKLIYVLGNTQFLLQNKLDSLDKFLCLDKMRDDEKIAFALSDLLNLMAVLVNQPKPMTWKGIYTTVVGYKTYDLEGNLYYGGGLQNLRLGRKFILW